MRRGNLQLRRKRPDPAVAHRKDGGEASIVQSRRDRHGQARAHISRLAGAKAKLGTPRPPDMLAYGAAITSVEHEPRFTADALLDRGKDVRRAEGELKQMLAQASRGPRRFIVPSLRVQRVKDIVRAFAHALEIKAGVDRAGDLVNIEGRAMKLACLEHLSSLKP